MRISGAEHCITSNRCFISKPCLRAWWFAGDYCDGIAGIFNAWGVTAIKSTGARRSRQLRYGPVSRLLLILRAARIAYRFDTSFERVEQEDGAYIVHLGDGGEPVPADVVLVATGRRPFRRDWGWKQPGLRSALMAKFPSM
jgi:glutathione reductase (NADPH)